VNALNPSPQLLSKLGSIVVHADEYLGPDGHQFDLEAMRALLCDQEVNEWCIAMRSMALIPERRIK
jgi:hypothetical protein